MSKYDNAANAINKRLVSLAKTYGINHPAYQNYANKVKMEQIPAKYKDGILQISRSEKGLSPYQKARVEQLKKTGATVSKVRERYRKKHPEAKTRADIDKAIKKGMERQAAINKALDNIYKYMDEGILPTDIVDKYNNFREHDTSNEEIDEMLEQIAEFDSMYEDIKKTIDEAQAVEYLPDDIEQAIWEIGSGRLTLDNVKEELERIKNYLATGGAYDTDD